MASAGRSMQAIDASVKCEIASAARNRSAEHHRHQEKGEDGLDHESGCRRDRDGRGAQGEVVGERGRAEAGSCTAQHGPQHERADDAANELTDDITGHFAGAHRADGEHANSDGGVHMPSRPGTVGEGEDHDGQAVGEGNRGDTGQADTVADHRSGAGADEHDAKVPMNSARSLDARQFDIGVVQNGPCQPQQREASHRQRVARPGSVDLG
jgi:hypothetical protein